jgi:hypothetical protein
LQATAVWNSRIQVAEPLVRLTLAAGDFSPVFVAGPISPVTWLSVMPNSYWMARTRAR